jgi:hypothetical protein
VPKDRNEAHLVLDRIAQNTRRREPHVSLTDRHKLHDSCATRRPWLQLDINAKIAEVAHLLRDPDRIVIHHFDGATRRNPSERAAVGFGESCSWCDQTAPDSRCGDYTCAADLQKSPTGNACLIDKVFHDLFLHCFRSLKNGGLLSGQAGRSNSAFPTGELLAQPGKENVDHNPHDREDQDDREELCRAQGR